MSAQKERFDIGLRRLLMSAESVAEMRQELEDLKPRLIVKSVEAEEMLVKVEGSPTLTPS